MLNWPRARLATISDFRLMCWTLWSHTSQRWASGLKMGWKGPCSHHELRGCWDRPDDTTLNTALSNLILQPFPRKLWGTNLVTQLGVCCEFYTTDAALRHHDLRWFLTRHNVKLYGWFVDSWNGYIQEESFSTGRLLVSVSLLIIQSTVYVIH